LLNLFVPAKNKKEGHIPKNISLPAQPKSKPQLFELPSQPEMKVGPTKKKEKLYWTRLAPLRAQCWSLFNF